MELPKTIQDAFLDLLGYRQHYICRCRDCGDRYEAEERLGCFGPMGSQVRCLPSPSPAEDTDVPILCAHCGHDVWAAPAQVLLRRAFRLKRRLGKVMDGEVRHLVRNEAIRRLSLWVAQLRLDHFRQLAPVWFAALWEEGPNPNPKTSLPSTHEKKVRFFLHQVARPEPMQAWPPLPPADLSGIEACRDRLSAYLALAQRLAPGLKGLGTTQALSGGAFVRPTSTGFRRPDSRPGHGNTYFCYHLEEVDGPNFAKGLLALARLDAIYETDLDAICEPDLDAVCGTDLNAPLHDPEAPILKDRLDILLHQHGLARSRK